MQIDLQEVVNLYLGKSRTTVLTRGSNKICEHEDEESLSPSGGKLAVPLLGHGGLHLNDGIDIEILMDGLTGCQTGMPTR